MKPYFFLTAAAASTLAFTPQLGRAQNPSGSSVFETPREFIGLGDFDGDGRQDVAIVDKDTGKYRLGYQSTAGALSWVDCRPSGIKGITGFTLGKLLVADKDALAFTSPDENQITVVDVSSSTAPSKPVTIPFSAGLGPNTLVALDVGGAGNTPLADLFVGSIYNSPDANQDALIRNDRSEFPKVADGVLAGPALRGDHFSLKSGQPEVLGFMVHEDKGDTLQLENVSGGQLAPLAAVAELPAGSEYTLGNFRGSPLREFLIYKPGENNLTVRPVEEAAPGKYSFSAGAQFDLGQPVRRVFPVSVSGSQKLLVLFGQGEKAGIYDFDGSKAPVLKQTLSGSNDLFTCALSLGKGFVVFLQPATGKFSNRYQVYEGSTTYAMSKFGSLPSLADNDNITIPEIHSRIAAVAPPEDPSQMKPYTNTIPGTRVTFAMIPIPGGEYIMGSPDGEPSRKADEGPQHKVKISPFWMGKFEVTWNEYELFMYPDEERRTRATVPTDAAGDKLADVVTHPSKPYVEMSFGMGKDGFPAISMTQHAANKYCQWLSAKTGQFYRLPTEAEWEYACRAGTKSTYFFGDDATKLPEYAWFEQNSDFKYQKVGRKKPNPWGLYDIYGNVVEWVLDQYDPDFYKESAAAGEAVDPWRKATKPYPHAVRGGSWDDEAAMCRSAARRGSERAWKMQDPQLPKSVWYFSDAQWVGFRVVRPLKVPPPEQMQKYWTSGVERD